MLIIGLSVYLTWLSQERVVFFQKIERLAKLAFFLKENGYIYNKRLRQNQELEIKLFFLLFHEAKSL